MADPTPEALAQVIFEAWPHQHVGSIPPQTWEQAETNGSSDYYHRIAAQVMKTFINPALAEQARESGCPCLFTTPCSPRCSCLDRYSSSGCSRCCRYGSLEQRQSHARRLAEQAQGHPESHPAALCSGPEQLRLEDEITRQAQEIARLTAENETHVQNVQDGESIRQKTWEAAAEIVEEGQAHIGGDLYHAATIGTQMTLVELAKRFRARARAAAQGETGK